MFPDQSGGRIKEKAPFQAPPSRILKLNWLLGEPRRTRTSNRLIKNWQLELPFDYPT